MLQVNESSLAHIDFRDTTIDCVRCEDEIMVSIVHVCGAIPIDLSGEISKLRDTPSLSLILVKGVGREGDDQKIAMMDLKYLPGWLATMKPSRRGEWFEDEMFEFVNELEGVIRDHFRLKVSPESTANPQPTPAKAATPAQPKFFLSTSELATRAALFECVRGFCSASGCDYAHAWGILFWAVEKQCGVDIRRAAERRGKDNVEFAEECGLIPTLYASAISLFDKAKPSAPRTMSA